MPVTFVQGCCLGTSNLSAVKVILKRLPVLDCRNLEPPCSCLFCPLTLFLAQNTSFFHVFIFKVINHLLQLYTLITKTIDSI